MISVTHHQGNENQNINDNITSYNIKKSKTASVGADIRVKPLTVVETSTDSVSTKKCMGN